jgi:hypothetical protein
MITGIKFHRLSEPKFQGGKLDLTTVGYWWFSKPYNAGTIHVEVLKMKNWRHEVAVWGHEFLEVMWCWLVGCTTEEADKFDLWYESEYASGRISKDKEAGDDRRCPYHWGHMAGVCWEYFWIYLSFGFRKGWDGYTKECNELMGIE